MKNLNDLGVKEKITDLAVKYNLNLLVLFGSRAKNKFKVNSDYDLAFSSKFLFIYIFIFIFTII